MLLPELSLHAFDLIARLIHGDARGQTANGFQVLAGAAGERVARRVSHRGPELRGLVEMGRDQRLEG